MRSLLPQKYNQKNIAPVVPDFGSHPKRILVYCHDLYGLGNVRRMLLFCHHLRAAYPAASLLFLMGGSNISLFNKPTNFDVIKLPELSRDHTGALGPRSLTDGLEPVLEIRKSLIAACAATFDPDLLIVDKKPLGASGELEPMLLKLPRSCRRILVTRDILDAPDVTIAELQTTGFEAAIDRHFDQVQVLGEKHVFDFPEVYQLSKTCAAKIHFTGFLTPMEKACPRETVFTDLALSEAHKTVLVTVGGGEDGLSTLEAALDYAETESDPPQLILLAGPNLSPLAYLQIAKRAEQLPHVRLLQQSNKVHCLIEASDVVVSMAGYNSVCGIMAAGKPAVLLPRVEPSKEQLVRAEMLAKRGLVSFVLPHEGSDALAQAIRKALCAGPKRQHGFDFDIAGTTRRIANGCSQVGLGAVLN